LVGNSTSIKMFNKKRRIEKLETEIDNIKRELDAIKKFDGRIEIELLKNQILSLRGALNRRLKRFLEKEERDEDEEGEDYKNNKAFKGVILPE